MNYFISRFRLWFLNHEEKKFLKKTDKITRSKSKSFSLIQCPHDLLYTHNFKKIILDESKYYFGGICPNLGYLKFRNWVLFFPGVLYVFHSYIIRRKWKKIYSKLGINLFFYSKNLKFSSKLNNLKNAIKFFRRLKTKEELLNHMYKGILCGDLIYDSYLRFNKKPTVQISDLTLILYIYDCYNQIDYFKLLASKYKIIKYYSSYSTYISHGIPVRVFLKNQVQVYTIAYSNYERLEIKELNINDFLQGPPHWKYRKIFKSFDKKKDLIKIGWNTLKKRFDGNNDLSYLKKNQYSPSYKSPKLVHKYDGVVFIGDFFDSQHIYRSMVFNDLYEWLIHTIKLTIDNRLNIAFKPHPNQLEGSKEIIDKIKVKYPKVNWLDDKISNKVIFSSGIKFGVSVYGMVLSELAFHKILPICCGDNPASNYDFIFQAKNKKEYDNLILKNQMLKFDKNIENQIGEFYYMNNLYFHYC